MTHRSLLNLSRAALSIALALAAVVPALAGPPLICRPFDIGTASSLPWNTGPNWKGTIATYDVSHVTADTLALLTDTTPILVRMESLRRAAIYATTEKRAATELLNALMTRAKAAGPDGKLAALALFDAGYLVESYKQLNHINGWSGALVSAVDGRAMVERSLDMRGGDPAIAFAASLMTQGESHANHLRQAQEGAKADQLLAKNLAFEH
jgi:hypothetical protein